MLFVIKVNLASLHYNENDDNQKRTFSYKLTSTDNSTLQKKANQWVPPLSLSPLLYGFHPSSTSVKMSLKKYWDTLVGSSSSSSSTELLSTMSGAVTCEEEEQGWAVINSVGVWSNRDESRRLSVHLSRSCTRLTSAALEEALRVCSERTRLRWGVRSRFTPACVGPVATATSCDAEASGDDVVDLLPAVRGVLTSGPLWADWGERLVSERKEGKSLGFLSG